MNVLPRASLEVSLPNLKEKVLSTTLYPCSFWIYFGLLGNFLKIITYLKVTNSPLFVWSLA